VTSACETDFWSFTTVDRIEIPQGFLLILATNPSSQALIDKEGTAREEEHRRLER
jgi:hypothetical protein